MEIEQQQQRLQRQQEYIYAYIVQRQERLENGVYEPFDAIICRRCESTISSDEHKTAQAMQAADIEQFFLRQNELPVCSNCGRDIGKTAHRRAAAQRQMEQCQQG